MARKKKSVEETTEKTILRNYDIYSLENRVHAMDKKIIRSYDIYSLEKRIHELEKNGGGGGTSYPYYETEDGKIGLLVIDADNKFGVFYFKGVTIPEDGLTISDENMTDYIPGGIPGAGGFNGAMCKGYSDANNTSYVGDICFMNDKLSMLSKDHTTYIAETAYGCMVVCGNRGGSEYYMTQLTEYKNPSGV